jgi:DNA-binding response OmpR family regulator
MIINKKKILVVDDERALVSEITLLLETQGWSVICAYDGEEGLNKAINERPDLVLLDIVMPKLSGYQVCRRMKDDPNAKDIPVIMWTSKFDESTKLTVKDVGSEDLIIKPYNADGLVKKIRALLAKA